MTGSTTNKISYFAFCSSINCSKYRAEGKLKENVVGKPVDCPDCGSALFWSNENKFRHRAASNKRSVKSDNFKYKFY